MPNLKIALLADLHLTADPGKAAHGQHLGRILREVQSAAVDVVLLAGDLADDCQPEQWTLVRRQIQSLRVPAFWVPGNHDIGAKPNPADDDVMTSERYTAFVSAMGPGYWTARIGGMRVIGIASSLFGTGCPEEHLQWKMMEEALQTPEDTVLLTHYPLFIEAEDEPGSYWNMDPQPRQRCLEMLRSGGVRAVLSGHIHRPLLHRRAGVAFIGAPPVSFNLPGAESEIGWSKMVLSPDSPLTITHHFANQRAAR